MMNFFGNLWPRSSSDVEERFSYTEEQREYLRNNFRTRNEYGYVLGQGSDEIKEAFIRASEALLSDEHVPSSHEFIPLTINRTLFMAKYILPSGEQKTIDLHKFDVLPDQVREYLELANAGVKPNPGFRAHSKGDAFSSRKILDRTPQNSNAKEIKDKTVLSQLPNDTQFVYEKLMPKLLRELPNPEERITTAKRLLFADFMRNKMIESLNEKISKLGNADHALAERLRKARIELESLDLFALGHLLSVQTVPRLDKESLRRILEARAQEVEDQVRADPSKKELEKEYHFLRELIGKVGNYNIYTLSQELGRNHIGGGALTELAPVRKLVENLVREIKEAVTDKEGWFFNKKKRDLAPKEIEYIQDAVGVLFTNRWDYSAYCTREQIQMKQEGLIDILYREAVRFADNAQAYAQGFGESSLGEFFGGPEFFNEISEYITQQLGNIDADAFDSAEAPAGIPPEALAEHHTKQEEKLRADLEALRGKLGRDATAEDIRKRNRESLLQPSPTVRVWNESENGYI